MSDELKGAFLESLKRTNKEIKEARAKSIGSSAETFYRRKIEDMDMEIQEMLREQEDMLDMSPSSALSLQLATDFKADVFTDTDVKLVKNIRNQKVILKEVAGRYEYLFGQKVNLQTNLEGIS